MAFGVSVTQEIWNSTRSPRTTATRFHQLIFKTSLPPRDAVLKNFASKTHVNTLICKQTLIDEEFLKNYMQDQTSMINGDKAVLTHPGISGTQNGPVGPCIESRIVIMQHVVNLAKEDPESPPRVVCDDIDVFALFNYSTSIEARNSNPL